MLSETLCDKASSSQARPRPALKIARAAHLGMCFGVRDAIALAKSVEKPLTILGELVHNESVVADLKAAGVQMEKDVDRVATAAVMITAHGTSDRQLERIRRRGLEVTQATCPLVHYAHRSVRNLVAQNYHPIIIGQAGHVEVRGLTEDLAEFDIILTEQDVQQLRERPRFGIAVQTTQPLERARHLTELIAARFPQSEIRFVDTVCQPTKQRQTAAAELAAQSDVVVVIGGAHSNNTRQLAETCRRFCPRVHHIQRAEELRGEWFAGAEIVGVTAGTSTPEWIIEQVERRLARIGQEDETAWSQLEPKRALT